LRLLRINCDNMKNDRIGIPKESNKKKHGQKIIFNSKAHRMAEKEYEEYYNRIKLLSKGV